MIIASTPKVLAEWEVSIEILQDRGVTMRVRANAARNLHSSVRDLDIVSRDIQSQGVI